jgi:hypothetical protein
MAIKEKGIALKLTVHSYDQEVALWKGLFNLVGKEVQVIASLIRTWEGELCSTEHRERVSKDLNILRSTVNVYIKRLKDKRVLRLNKDGSYDIAGIFKGGDRVEITFNRTYGRDVKARGSEHVMDQ